MAKFVFKLQTVLKHRKLLEQEKLRVLFEAQASLKALEDELAEMNRSVDSTNQDLRRNRLTGTIDVMFLIAHRRFLLGMQKKAVELARKIADAAKVVQAAQAALAEAARNRKVLEKLREKQFERWREEQARKELAQLDEVGSQLGYERIAAARETSIEGIES